MEVTVTVDDAEVRRKLAKLGGQIEKAMQEGLRDTIVDIANTVINVHPWRTRTGNNSRSIRYEQKGLTASVSSSSGYGGFLETGTVKMAAYPYFRPAIDTHLPKLGDHIKEHL